MTAKYEVPASPIGTARKRRPFLTPRMYNEGTYDQWYYNGKELISEPESDPAGMAKGNQGELGHAVNTLRPTPPSALNATARTGSAKNTPPPR